MSKVKIQQQIDDLLIQLKDYEKPIPKNLYKNLAKTVNRLTKETKFKTYCKELDLYMHGTYQWLEGDAADFNLLKVTTDAIKDTVHYRLVKELDNAIDYDSECMYRYFVKTDFMKEINKEIKAVCRLMDKYEKLYDDFNVDNFLDQLEIY